MENNLLDKMLTDYLERKLPITLVLQNKARVSGLVRSFDNYVIVLQSQKNEIIYRHAVSCMLPASVSAPSPAIKQQVPQQKAPHRTDKRPPPTAGRKQPQQPAPRSDAKAESGLNTGMKDGLLRWMQEQKTAK